MFSSKSPEFGSANTAIWYVTPTAYCQVTTSPPCLVPSIAATQALVTVSEQPPSYTISPYPAEEEADTAVLK